MSKKDGINRGDKPPRGPGWGGPAKGAGHIAPRKPIAEAAKARGTPEGRANYQARKERDAAVAERMRGVLAGVADNEDENSHARVSAAVALLNRIEGMPVARNINADVPVEAVDESKRTPLTDFLSEFKRKE